MSTLGTMIADRLEGTRRRTLEIFAPLPREHLVAQPSPLLSPPVWDLGHIAAYEELWLVRRIGGGRAIHPQLDQLYDAAETPRRDRGTAPLLPPEEALRFLRDVRARSLEVLAGADLGDEADPLTRRGFAFEMVVEHEAQHSETVLQAMQMLPPGAYRPEERRELPASRRDAGGWAEVGPAVFRMGADGPGFAYDCERPCHVRAVDGFLMARDPVTNAEHLAFVEDGGYRRRELWTDAGWAWREAEGAEAPLYWERDGQGGWLERAFDEVRPLDPPLPVCHVSAHEADAHARWAGARLPTEVEWECAAQGTPVGTEWGNLDQTGFGRAPVGAHPENPAGVRGMLGDVWEWTSSAFVGYPGFRAFPYPEYAEVFFGPAYRVLRGGSWATRSVAARPSFRNWDLPERRQIFSGLRLVRDLQ
jgi:iron(II)-dependent oxidoreductase